MVRDVSDAPTLVANVLYLKSKVDEVPEIPQLWWLMVVNWGWYLHKLQCLSEYKGERMR